MKIIYAFIKRLFDIVSSFLLIIILSWLLLIIVIINLIAAKGSPIYSDKRVGKNGKTIGILKFRSMYRDANSNPKRYLNKQQYEHFLKERKVDNDPRITWFGKFLRKTSLDELPQLLNIFVGNMSVVGPRPVIKKELEDNYSKEEVDLYLSVRPGLISNWGVNGRNNVSYDSGERQKLELEYFEKRSLRYDVLLMFKAVIVVITRQGAK